MKNDNFLVFVGQSLWTLLTHVSFLVSYGASRRWTCRDDEANLDLSVPVVRAGSTGMLNRSSSRVLPLESNYCEIVLFCFLLGFFFFGWSPISLIFISVSTRSPSEEPALRCCQATAGHREKWRQSLSFCFLVVTFLADKWSRGHKQSRLELCCQDLCANKNLFCTFFYHVKVYFITTSFSYWQSLTLRFCACVHKQHVYKMLIWFSYLLILTKFRWIKHPLILLLLLLLGFFLQTCLGVFDHSVHWRYSCNPACEQCVQRMKWHLQTEL